MGVKVKRAILLVILVLIILQLAVSVAAAPKYKWYKGSNSGSDNVFMNALNSVLKFAEDFFNSDADRLNGLLKIMIGILVFAITYWGFSALNGAGIGGGTAVPQGIAITISIVIAIMTIIFIPNEIYEVMGLSLAAVFILVFYAAIIAFVLYLNTIIPAGAGRRVWAIIMVVVLMLVIIAIKTSVWGLLEASK
jgi:hypothetical protein